MALLFKVSAKQKGVNVNGFVKFVPNCVAVLIVAITIHLTTMNLKEIQIVRTKMMILIPLNLKIKILIMKKTIVTMI